MNKKLQAPGWAEWKLAGLSLGALKVYCRLWTTTAVIDGRQLPHRIEVRHGNGTFGTFQVRRYELGAGKEAVP